MNRKLIIEFLGTFFLILTVALTGNPLAIGTVLIALVYMGGYISGANYNPAVTLALALNGKLKIAEAVQYMITQFVAGLMAAAVYLLIKGDLFIPTIATDAGLESALLVEVLFTFLLCSVVLHTAATDKTKHNQYYGLAIGLTLMAAAFAAGPISGGAINPAVGASPLLFDFANLDEHSLNISIYLIGPLAGGLIAGIVYKMLGKE